MKKLLIKQNDGFSLVELMTALLVTSIFAISFYHAFGALRNQMFRQTVYYETHKSVRVGLDRIGRDAKEAVNIAASWGGNNTGNTVLVLKLASINALGEPTNITSQFDYVTYRLSPTNATQLVRSLDVLNGVSSREGGTDKTNALLVKNMQGLYFSSSGTGLSSYSATALQGLKYINAQLTAQGRTLGVNQTAQTESDFVLRNKIS